MAQESRLGFDGMAQDEDYIVITGAILIFLGVLRNRTRAERTRAAWQAAGTSLFVITIFALFGQFIVNYLDISMPALQGAGGLLLLLVSLELLKGNDTSTENDVAKNLALVPLGTPLLAGPGAIVTIMLFAQDVESSAMAIALWLASSSRFTRAT